MRTRRRGQALMELAVGMFTLALLTSALCAFVIFIAKSLKIQNHLRSSGRATYAAKVELDAFAADTVFGMQKLHILEPRGNTDRSIP